jgi:hypothetical protein
LKSILKHSGICNNNKWFLFQEAKFSLNQISN